MNENLIEVECEFCEEKFMVGDFDDDGSVGTCCNECFKCHFGESN